MKASTTTDKPIASSTLIVPRPRSEMYGVTRRIIHLLLAPQTLWALLCLPLGLFLYKVAVYFDSPLSTIFLNHTPLFVIAFLAVLGLIFGTRLRAIVDRFFFRQPHHQEQLLQSFLEHIANFNEISEVIYRTCQICNEAFQSTPLHFFFRASDSRDLKLVYSYGAAAEIMQIPEGSHLRSLLKRERCALEYPLHQGLSLPSTEQEWMERLQARMLVPMHGKDHRLLGLFTLGENRTGQAYGPNDLALLEAVAQQIARRVEQEQMRNQISEQSKAPLAMLARLEAEAEKQRSVEEHIATESVTETEAIVPNLNQHDHENQSDITADEKSLWI